MTELEKAARMALEAMELHAEMYPHMQKGYTVDAIEALRTALTQSRAMEGRKHWSAALADDLIASGDVPAPQQATPEPVKPLFATKVAARKWAELQEQGHRMQSLSFDGGPGGAGTIDPWGVVAWGTPERKGEPFGQVTVKHPVGPFHAPLYTFYPWPQPPYLDNVQECHTVYTSPQVPEDVQRDAERYRWLRDKGRYNDFRVEQEKPGWVTTHSAGSLDAAIDAARKGE